MLKDLEIVDTAGAAPVTIDIVSDLPAPVAVTNQLPSPIAKKSVLGRKSLKVENPLVEQWLVFLKDFSGLKSAQSERTYRNAIGQLLNWFKDNDKNIFTATTADVREWRDAVKVDKSPATVELYLVAARLFFAWLCNEGVIKQNPCNVGGLNLKSGVKVEREHKRADLSVEQIQEMLATMPAQTEMELRNRAVVALMCTAGLRGVEVSEAQCGDLRAQGGYMYLVVRGKGHSEKALRVKVEPNTEKMLRQYWAVRFDGKYPKDKDFMFVSTSRNRTADADEQLSTRTIRAICKKAMKAIGLDDKQHSAHSLRHSACSIALAAGEALPDVKDMMRHSRLDTTLLYQHAYTRERNNAELTVGKIIFG